VGAARPCLRSRRPAGGRAGRAPAGADDAGRRARDRSRPAAPTAGDGGPQTGGRRGVGAGQHPDRPGDADGRNPWRRAVDHRQRALGVTAGVDSLRRAGAPPRESAPRRERSPRRAHCSLPGRRRTRRGQDPAAAGAGGLQRGIGRLGTQPRPRSGTGAVALGTGPPRGRGAAAGPSGTGGRHGLRRRARRSSSRLRRRGRSAARVRADHGLPARWRR
jgi:hypothetical protein